MSETQHQLSLFAGEASPGDNQLFLGTSSWTGEGWVGSFYPAGSKPADFLPFYARHFRTVEVDSTFYRIPAANTVKQWRERTPKGFIFAAKVPQVITHEKVLVDAERDLKDFLDVMDLLGDGLGPLLLQFPYFNKHKFRGLGFFLKRLQPFLDNLPRQYQWAVEIRNKTWLSEKLYSVLRQHGVALALVDHAWMPRPQEYFEAGDPVTANFSYIRWIGDRKGIEEKTQHWDHVIIDREDDMRIWIPIIHQILKRRIQVMGYFNNHYAGFAPGSIKLFNEMWEKLGHGSA
jgi:uncharacterized protein YecE (DUF72 family)